ncbi:MAG: hypothetical protein R6X02_09945 [Enhygromyxa sp.]
MRARALLCLTLSTLLLGCWSREAAWEAADARRSSVARAGESEAERLYRHGRDCMDTLERDDCAIDYFEQLIELGPDRRDLVGDATFRLVDLYRRHAKPEQATLLLRKFWELGMELGSAGVVPYGTRFAPPTLTSMVMIDVDRLAASRLHQDLPEDAKDMMFTCDEARREQLRAEVEARREAKRAERLAAMSPEEREAHEKQQAKRRERFRGSSNEELSEDEKQKQREEERTVFGELCTIAAALGLTDYRDFSLFMGASNHDDSGQSVALVRVATLEERLAESVEAGRLMLEPEQPIEGRELSQMPQGFRDKLRVWTVVGHEFRGAPVQLMSFDKNELFVAPKALVPELLHARAHDQTRLDPKLRELIEQVPADVAFTTIITPQATQAFMSEMGTMAKLLPNPQGLLIAAVVYDYAGLFVRVPTEDSVKAWVILSLARKLLDGAQAEEDDGEVNFMTNMDISQAPDGKALLMSNILTRAAVTQVFLGY